MTIKQINKVSKIIDNLTKSSLQLNQLFQEIGENKESYSDLLQIIDATKSIGYRLLSKEQVNELTKPVSIEKIKRDSKPSKSS